MGLKPGEISARFFFHLSHHLKILSMTQKELNFMKDNRHLTVDQMIAHFEVPVIKKFKDRIEYRVLGKLHREDGPALEWVDGGKEWYLNGKLHREDGPAVECADGDKSWWVNGKLHREDGPAVECADGDKSWWVNGEDVDPF